MKIDAANNGQHQARTLDCTWLLAALLTLLLLLPLVEYGRVGKVVLALLATLTFLGGIRAVSASRAHMLWGVVLLIPPLILEWLNSIGLITPRLFSGSSLYSVPFYLFLGELIRRYIFQPGPVTRSRLVAALCFYLLMGVCWAHVYVVVLHVNPDAFANIASPYRVIEMMYYSFVTLTTLGYGEITPISMTARSLAILEATTGVLYMGALVARLAGSMKFSVEGEGSV